jgi:predicted transcriptional regulator
MVLAENPTFVVIIAVVLVLAAWAVIYYVHNKTKNKNVQHVEEKTSDISAAVADSEVNVLSDDQLIAVLSAAIAASMNDTGFRVKSFRRLPQPDSLWNTTARHEQVIGRVHF